LYGRSRWYHVLAGLDRVDDDTLRGIGLVPYERAKYTQSLDRLGGFDYKFARIRATPREMIDEVWNVPGGLVGIKGWESHLYSIEPGTVKKQAFLPVHNGRHWQEEVGWTQTYAKGTLFVDRLSTAMGDFETRAAEKVGDKEDDWIHYVVSRNKAARPAGYEGLKGQSCIDCHQHAGTANYGLAAVPGSDRRMSKKLLPEDR
jgi:hypothetical protein